MIELLKKRKDIRITVIIVVIVNIVALALHMIWVLSPSSEATTVVVSVGGAEVLRRPLYVNAEYEIPQEDGAVNVICVEDGAVYMKTANCRDGLCLRQGKVRWRAQTIVCLPHELVVKLEGDAGAPEDDIDVIIQ